MNIEKENLSEEKVAPSNCQEKTVTDRALNSAVGKEVMIGGPPKEKNIKDATNTVALEDKQIKVP